MDTAKNIMEYMEVIHTALKQGGTWINIGPLLYHFEDSLSGESSIELSLESVKEVAHKMGFEIKVKSALVVREIGCRHTNAQFTYIEGVYGAYYIYIKS